MTTTEHAAATIAQVPAAGDHFSDGFAYALKRIAFHLVEATRLATLRPTDTDPEPRQPQCDFVLPYRTGDGTLTSQIAVMPVDHTGVVFEVKVTTPVKPHVLFAHSAGLRRALAEVYAERPVHRVDITPDGMSYRVSVP